MLIGRGAVLFKVRAIAQSRREENPKLYPYLGIDCEYLVSMRPAYRENLIRLVRMVNEDLRAMASELQSELENAPNVRVQYSDALARTDVGRVEVLHEVDGWHASVAGHNVFAEAAFSAFDPSLKFLGIDDGSDLSETREREDQHLQPALF